jgi:hypothetical protein
LRAVCRIDDAAKIATSGIEHAQAAADRRSCCPPPSFILGGLVTSTLPVELVKIVAESWAWTLLAKPAHWAWDRLDVLG